MDHLPYPAKLFFKMHLCLNSGFEFYLLIKCDKQNIIIQLRNPWLIFSISILSYLELFSLVKDDVMHYIQDFDELDVQAATCRKSYADFNILFRCVG